MSPGLSLDGNLVGAHPGVPPQQTFCTAPPMSLCERVAAHPRVEGLAVAPPRYDEHLVACIGSQYLHGDEPGKPWTLPRLSRNLSTTRSAAPSFTGRLLKIAITRATGSMGDHDAASADALGHL